MRDEDDKHADMIHFLRDSTQLSRFTRHEVREFIERLDAEGYEIAKKAQVGFPFQVYDPTVIDV
jgi:tellurite resistance protein